MNNDTKCVTVGTVYGTKKNYGKATELLRAVRELLVIDMTDEARVSELQKRNFKISTSTFKRIKAWIRNTPQQRLDYIAHTEFVQFHLDAIDTMNYINKKCLELAESDNPLISLKAISEVRENLKVLANIYDSNPIVKAIAKKMEERKIVS